MKITGSEMTNLKTIFQKIECFCLELLISAIHLSFCESVVFLAQVIPLGRSLWSTTSVKYQVMYIKLCLKDCKSPSGKTILKVKQIISFHFPNPNLLLVMLSSLALSLWIYFFPKVKSKCFIWSILKFW